MAVAGGTAITTWRAPVHRISTPPASSIHTTFCGVSLLAITVTAQPAVTTAAPATAPGSAARIAIAAGSVLHETTELPTGLVHRYPDSNAWAANGRAVAGVSMLAGDPHLPQTLPSVWYQVALSAPGLAVTGVTVPGLPGVLIGHNAHVAWSLTDVQAQATLFYAEQTSPARRGQYFWQGAWRPIQIGTNRQPSAAVFRTQEAEKFPYPQAQFIPPR